MAEIMIGVGNPDLPLKPIRMDFSGFNPGERLEFKAQSHKNAAFQYGRSMKDITQKQLSDMFEDETLKKTTLATAGKALRNFEKLSQTGVFTVDKVNYGQRYLDQIDGFAAGSGISREESAYLQMEFDTGCQTLFVQHKETGEISFIHTEENVEDTELIKLNRKSDWKKPPEVINHTYDYRAVTIDENGKKIDFFGYPGLSGGGPAMGINHQTGTFVAVDTLFTSQEGIHPGSSVWTNAVAGMILDVGDIDKVRILAEKMKMSKIKFSGGYAIHLAQTGENPRMTSFEFGADKVEEVSPKELPDRKTIGQPNFARSASLFGVDELNPDVGVTDNDPEMRQWSVEMKRRKRRLELMGALVQLPKDGITDIKTAADKLIWLEKLAANPYGDIDTTDPQARIKRDLTSLPSVWQAGYAIGFIEKNGMHARIGKRQPPPIPGKEYGLRENTSRYARKDLSKIDKSE